MIDSIIEKYDDLITRRKTIDFLFIIASNMKPGDEMDYIPDPVFIEMLFPLLFLRNNGFFEFVNEKFEDQVRFTCYNPNTLPNKELLDVAANKTADSYSYGTFYGYPPCCIENFRNEEKITRYGARYGASLVTQHGWCDRHCRKSKELQNHYLNILLANTPELLHLVTRENIFYKQDKNLRDLAKDSDLFSEDTLQRIAVQFEPMLERVYNIEYKRNRITESYFLSLNRLHRELKDYFQKMRKENDE